MVTRALVCGGSGGGIGKAVCEILRSRGVNVTSLSRTDGLDFSDLSCADATLGDLAATKPGFDLIFDATGILAPNGGAGPERTIRKVEPDAMAEVFAVNTFGPALLLKHYFQLSAPKGRTVFATLSARVGSIGDNNLGGWISYRASKTALNQIVHTAAIEIAARRPDAVCVALHPGTVRTPLSADFVAKREGVLEPTESAGKLLAVLEGLQPKDSGQFFDYAGKKIVW